MDEKKEDLSEESFQNHLVFYKKLNHTINQIQNEIQESVEPEFVKHLNERIDAIKLDQARIRKMFPNTQDKIWDDLEENKK